MKPQPHQAHIYLPVALWRKLKQIAKLNRRTASAEIVIAVEKHVRNGDAK